MEPLKNRFFTRFLFGKRNGSRRCLVQYFGCAGTNLGCDFDLLEPGHAISLDVGAIEEQVMYTSPFFWKPQGGRAFYIFLDVPVLILDVTLTPSSLGTPSPSTLGLLQNRSFPRVDQTGLTTGVSMEGHVRWFEPVRFGRKKHRFTNYGPITSSSVCIDFFESVRPSRAWARILPRRWNH